MIKIFFAIFLLSLSFFAEAKPKPKAKRAIEEGTWHFQMKTTYAVIPFVIEFRYMGSKLKGTLRNGKELIPLDGIVLKKETIKIPLQLYENALELQIMNKEILRGDFVRYNKNPVIRMPVEGKKGESQRYPGKFENPAKIEGRWAVTLTEDDGKQSKGVVVFEQDGSKIHGSILSSTGDYRYLEGFINGEFFEAASFDGVYNYVFKGRIEKDKIEASILANYMTKISGIRDGHAQLPDASKQTQIDKLSFKFPDLKGKKISLTDSKFKNKAIVVTFYGTWCPNCVDETNYLIPWYHKNKSRGVEVIALAFERSLTAADSKKQLMKVVKKMKIPYTVLLAGVSAEDKPMDKITGLKNFISFPTTIFLNRKHEVVKVHAGFTGPSTGVFFDEWKKEFDHDVDGILK